MSSRNLLLASLSLGLLLGCHNAYQDSAVEAIKNTHRGDVEACVNDLRQRVPGAKGDVEVALEVLPDGKVTKLGYSKNETNDPGIINCMREKAVNWVMPPPSGGKPEVIKYRFRVSQ